MWPSEGQRELAGEPDEGPYARVLVAGACGVRLGLENPSAAWEEAVRGRLLLEGGGRPVRLRALEVSLFNSSQGSSAPAFDPQVHRWSWVEVPAGVSRELSFELCIPWGLAPGWNAAARAQIHAAEDWPSVLAVSLFVKPPAIFTRVADALAAAARLAIRGWSVAGAGDGAAAFLGPARGAVALVEAAQLVLFRSAGAVYGELVLTPRGRTVVERLAPGVRQRTWSFRFPQDDASAAEAFFAACLRPYLGGAGQLPIPAGGAPPSEDLPRPAGAPDPDD